MRIAIFKFFNKHYQILRYYIVVFDFFSNTLAELILVNLHFINLNLTNLNRLVLNNRSHDCIANGKVLFKYVLLSSTTTHKKPFTFKGFKCRDILNHIQRRTFEVVRQVIHVWCPISTCKVELSDKQIDLFYWFESYCLHYSPEDFLRLSRAQSLKFTINQFFCSFLYVLNTCLCHIIFDFELKSAAKV